MIDNRVLGQSMIRLFMGYIPTRVIYVAAKLELADHIGDGGARAQDLAQKLNVNPAALYRVMRVLTGLGVLHQDCNDRFFVTPFGETLRKDSPQSVRDYAIYNHEIVYDAFKDIADSISSGKPVIDDFFGFLRSNPDKEAVFHAGMSNRGRVETAAVLQAYKFPESTTVVDVGGGNGGFLSALLARKGTSRACYSTSHPPLKQQRRGAVVPCPAANWLRETSLQTYQPVATCMF